MHEKREKGVSLRHFFTLPMWDEDVWDLEYSGQSGLSVSEDQGHVYVEAQLPGLNSDDIELSLEKGVLWIRGEKKEEEEDKKRKFYRKASSSFSYRLHIPGQIDEKKEPDASYKDGVLKVVFTKTSQPQAKKISIKKS